MLTEIFLCPRFHYGSGTGILQGEQVLFWVLKRHILSRAGLTFLRKKVNIYYVAYELLSLGDSGRADPIKEKIKRTFSFLRNPSSNAFQESTIVEKLLREFYNKLK